MRWTDYSVIQHFVGRREYRWCAVLLLLQALSVSPSAVAGNVHDRNGITLQSTRIIYPEEESRGIAFTVTNDSLSPYLLQSRVDGWGLSLSASESPLPFIVTPPLIRGDAGEMVTLRIRRTQNTLPADRESVFAFQVKAIPSQSAEGTFASEEEVRMILALQNTLKLFYRPAGLPVYDAQSIAEALQFQCQHSRLTVHNPTAFYVTFDSLSVNGLAVERDALFSMVPPFGQRSYPLLEVTSSCDIDWSLVDDYGLPTTSITRKLNDGHANKQTNKDNKQTNKDKKS